jgi:ribosomal protein S1
VTGEVVWAGSAGAKVQLALPDKSPAQAWLPIREISKEQVSSAQEVFRAGDEVTAVVLSALRGDVSLGRSNIILGTRQLEVQAGDMLTNREAVAVGAEERAAQWLQEKAVRMQEQQQRSAALSKLKLGDVVTGDVVRIAPYGAFVQLKEGATALLHISQITYERLSSVALQQALQVGDEVRAKVILVDEEKGRVNLSFKQLEGVPVADQQTGPTIGHDNAEGAEEAMSRLQFGDVVTGVVDNIEKYGAFVQLKEGFKALLHISQITHTRLTSVQQVFKPGDTVVAMVLMDKARGRISLSTKKLEKNPGDMLTDRASVYETAEQVAAEFRARSQAEAEAEQTEG